MIDRHLGLQASEDVVRALGVTASELHQGGRLRGKRSDDTDRDRISGDVRCRQRLFAHLRDHGQRLGDLVVVSGLSSVGSPDRGQGHAVRASRLARHRLEQVVRERHTSPSLYACSRPVSRPARSRGGSGSDPSTRISPPPTPAPPSVARPRGGRSSRTRSGAHRRATTGRAPAWRASCGTGCRRGRTRPRRRPGNAACIPGGSRRPQYHPGCTASGRA